MFKFQLTYDNLRRALKHPYYLVDELLLQHFYRVPSTIYNAKVGIGENIFTKNWDVLIILDSCRVDALRALAPEYEFLHEINSLTSVGGSTPEWVANTFIPAFRDEISRVGYVAGTAQARGLLQEGMFDDMGITDGHIALRMLRFAKTVDFNDIGLVDFPFEYDDPTDSIDNHPQGKTPPRYVTDRAISIWRHQGVDRIIMHYMQPHAPYAANATRERRDLLEHERRPLRYLRDTGDHPLVWDAYLDEIRFALDNIEVALNNMEAQRVIITADHGEAFGEYGIYGHTVGSLHPMVRTVPWAETTAEDSGSYSPVLTEPRAENPDTEQILRSLGYKI